jgi:hypothetical protein
MLGMLIEDVFLKCCRRRKFGRTEIAVPSATMTLKLMVEPIAAVREKL